MSVEWVRAAVALGSNLGERHDHLSSAVRELTDIDGVRNLKASRTVETEPVGGPSGQGRYLNAAAVFETRLAPRGLLSELQRIEARHGRDRSSGARDEPRTLDLDLLLYGEHLIQEEDLIVPHPRMHLRLFVLEPLERIGPDWIVPGRDRTVRELYQALAEQRSGDAAR